MRKVLQKMSLLGMLLMLCIGAKAADVTATWDYSNATVMSATVALQSPATEGTVAAVEDNGVLLTVLANGATFRDNNGNIQVRQGAEFRVPVKRAGDLVVVKGYPDYSHYTIGGGDEIANTSANPQTEYKAKVADAEKGYVSIVSTNNNNYFYSITVTQYDPRQEKRIYAPDFAAWDVFDANSDNGTPNTHVVDFKTKYSGEQLKMTLWQTNVYAPSTGKVNKVTKGYLCGMKANAAGNNATITTEAFASVTRVKYFHIATGGNRGWGLKVKGTKEDGTPDEDWVTVYSTVTDGSGAAVEVKDINRTNVQLQFYNLSQSNYAALYDLEIYGMVDLSQQPMLGSFEANGVTYQAADIFDEDDEGNNVATIELSKKVPMVDETNNPLTNIVADNGDITSVTYTPANGGCKVTFVVEAAGKAANYIATFVQKPDYTLSYYNLDGSLIGSQIREKDQTIGEFDYTEGDVTGVPEGFKFRGWFIRPAALTKYSVDEVITGDINLYARATKIEDGTGVYIYNLTDNAFYAEDHDAFTSEGNGKFHDTTHGWDFINNDVVKLAVGGDAKILVTGCKYTAEGAAINVTSTSGTVSTASIPVDRTTDGVSTTIEYTGPAGEVVLTMTGTTYIHAISVVNLSGDVAKETEGYHAVKAGDVNSLLDAIAYASATNSTPEATPIKIFVPNGTYDLGETTLTKISGYNISIIGESQDGVVIVNAPDKSNEGINTTATFLNTSSNLYMQDITLQNALDYYGIGGTGRAVCLDDRGNRNIYKRVKMLSYQDTYVTDGNNGQLYWEDSEIHGTVDFICGGGDILFENTKLYVEPRKADGTGECTITAPTTTTSTKFGYVFNNCTIENHAASYNLGRSWKNTPKAVYLNTKMNQEPISTRWNLSGMNGIDMAVAAEYNSKDMNGNDVTPAAGTQQTFKNKNTTLTIVLTDAEAAKYTSANMFGEWAPETQTAQAAAPTATIKDNVITITPANGGDAGVYLIEKDGEFLALTSETTYNVSEQAEEGNKVTAEPVYTVRAANKMGGFGEAAVATVPTAIEVIEATAEAATAAEGAFVIDGKVVIVKEGKQFTAAGARIK